MRGGWWLRKESIDADKPESLELEEGRLWQRLRLFLSLEFGQWKKGQYRKKGRSVFCER